MNKDKNPMERFVRLLEFKMPTNVVGDDKKIEGNSDRIRLLAKRENDKLVLFILNRSPSRTDKIVKDLLNEHNADFTKTESPKGEMRSKYTVDWIDPSTFT